MAARRSKTKPARRRGWVRMSHERLLDVRMCDLDLEIRGTPVERRIRKVFDEIERRDLAFRPYFWISEDWFTPDAHTGVAISFYVFHPRLIRLERRMMGEAEGGTHEWCMRILRHEVGHAIQQAYRLNRRRRWQELFGLWSHRYPSNYQANPYSKRHVQHLEYWYAQSHPAEDFAETFAVWLGPKGRWRKRYKGWPALRKLEYVDELMTEIAGQTAPVRTQAYLDPIRTIRKTLREHYATRAAGAKEPWPARYDHDLRRLFSDQPRHRGCAHASAFIRRIQPEIRRLVEPWIGERRYHLDHVLKEIRGRCRDLKLRVPGAERRRKHDFSLLLVKHTMDSLYRCRRRIEM